MTIPFDGSVEELSHMIISKNKLPIYLEKELNEQLETFLDKHSIQDDFLSDIKDMNIDAITKQWEQRIREEISEYAEKRCASDAELFATAYHKLVHSPALDTMLQLEHMYSKTVRQKNDEKNTIIHQLSAEQSEEMNDAVDRLEQDITEVEINDLAARHYETHSMIKVQLTSELESIKEAQRREYREWLMQMLEQNQANSSLPTPNSPLTPISSMNQTLVFNRVKETKEASSPTSQESFTIHLGSQLKQMHNIRILSADVMDLCVSEDAQNLSEPTPQLLQTALALYSNDLSGLVLMTDNKIGSRTSEAFQKICQNSTEFHFTHIDQQLDDALTTSKRHVRDTNPKTKHTELLQPGDFYITKHSNLAEVHVVFHMVADDSLKSCNVNSRHPVVLGLRNILKIACSNDVTSITVPLLLQYETTEDMTVNWCEKRAELVFKCVKGFMIEMATWGGSDLKNLQFMLPQDISPQVFQSLSEMLPRIFKVSNPKILK